VAKEWLNEAEKMVGKLSPRQLALAAGGAGAVVVLVLVAIAAAFTRGGGGVAPLTTAATPAQPLPVTAVDPPRMPSVNVPSADDSSEVPTFSVDSLPVAARAPGKGNGRLSVAASPGWCSISVDGQQRGVTPLSTFELPAGSHRVDCVPPNGRTKTTTVNVAEGTATHFKFSMDE
jgi:hypothetical protein